METERFLWGKKCKPEAPPHCRPHMMDGILEKVKKETKK